MVTSFVSLEGVEAFDAANLGECSAVYEERVADDDITVIEGGKTSRACSLLLRGANMHMLDEVERSLHDALCVVKRVLESKAVVPGGGAVEAALSVYLEKFATELVAQLRAFHDASQTKEDKADMRFIGLDLAT